VSGPARVVAARTMSARAFPEVFPVILVSPSRTRSLVLVAIVVVLSACTTSPGASTPASAAPSASGAPATPAGASASASTASPGASAPASSTATQSTTEWGRIWDALPPSFPTYPGAQPTETGAAPATATLQLPVTVDAAAAWWRTALEGAGYRIEGVNGPLEDGSIVIDAEGGAGCRVQTSVAPLGGTTVATIHVGADCPFR
jgi:hypothetical protein